MKHQSYVVGSISLSSAAKIAIFGLLVAIASFVLLFILLLIAAAPILSMSAIVADTSPGESAPIVFESSAVFFKFAAALVVTGVIATAFGAWIMGFVSPLRVSIVENEQSET